MKNTPPNALKKASAGGVVVDAVEEGQCDFVSEDGTAAAHFVSVVVDAVAVEDMFAGRSVFATAFVAEHRGMEKLLLLLEYH